MFRLLRKNYIYFMVIFTIMFDELFFALLLSRGVFAESGIKQYEAIIYAALVYPVLFWYIIHNKIDKRGRRIISFVVAILVLYLITGVIYANPPEKYYTFLLSYGSECIPAAFLGIMFAKTINLERVNKILPLVLFPSAFLIGTIGLRTALMGVVLKGGSEDGGGLNYQSVSYYMAFAYTYFCYLCFFANFNKSVCYKLLKCLSFVFALFSAAVCLMSGGRGAFVLIILITLFLFFFYIKIRKLKLAKISLFLIFFISLTFAVVSYFGIMESAGMNRVMENLTNAGTREDFYHQAFNAFLDSPIWGNGLGSIWWTVGFYSHNMLLDLLAEVGIIGATIIVALLWRTFIGLCIKMQGDSICILVLLVFICAMVKGTFSGYWIGQMKLFFVCSFSYIRLYSYYLKIGTNVFTK